MLTVDRLLTQLKNATSTNRSNLQRQTKTNMLVTEFHPLLYNCCNSRSGLMRSRWATENKLDCDCYATIWSDSVHHTQSIKYTLCADCFSVVLTFVLFLVDVLVFLVDVLVFLVDVLVFLVDVFVFFVLTAATVGCFKIEKYSQSPCINNITLRGNK
jgi:hypothetical protein